MPSALFEMYQKNFDKSLKNLTEMIELYQNQSKEIQSFTLKEIELNISEMERAISKMELEIIIEKIPDNKKKLNKIITNNKNLVKQYKREIQDLKYKKESILNKNNLVNNINKINDKSPQINLLNIPYFEQNNNNDDEDIALFIDKNNSNKFNNCINDEINYKKDESIKRINENNKSDEMNLKSNQNNNLSLSTKKNKDENDKNDKDSQDNKYKLNKVNLFKKGMRIIINIIQYLFNAMINFYKNVVHNGFIKLKHYLNHRYGQANSLRIIMVLFVICFLIIYSFILYIVNSYKVKSTPNTINLIKKNDSKTLEYNNATYYTNTTNNVSTNVSHNAINTSNNNITNITNITSNESINNNIGKIVKEEKKKNSVNYLKISSLLLILLLLF